MFAKQLLDKNKKYVAKLFDKEMFIKKLFDKDSMQNSQNSSNKTNGSKEKTYEGNIKTGTSRTQTHRDGKKHIKICPALQH